MVQVRIMLRHGLSGVIKFLLPALLLATVSLLMFKQGSTREALLRLAIALPFIGFLWGLRVYEYTGRFSKWKDYLAGKASLAEAFSSIANRRAWFYIIPAAYLCGIAIGVIFYLITIFKGAIAGFYVSSFSAFNLLAALPACSLFILLGANIFGPKPDREEQLALAAAGILNQSPKIDPKDIESDAAIDRFVNGAMTLKEEDVKPYLWILSRIHSPRKIAAFRSALKSADPAVRQAAVNCLGRIGGSEALELMREHLDEESDPGIRQVITTVMGDE